MILGLRYYYETNSSTDALHAMVQLSSQDLVTILINFNLIRKDKRPSYASLGASYRFLEQHNIITRISGDFKEKNLTFYINPSIVFVVDYEVIQSLYKEIERAPDEFMGDNL